MVALNPKRYKASAKIAMLADTILCTQIGRGEDYMFETCVHELRLDKGTERSHRYSHQHLLRALKSVQHGSFTQHHLESLQKSHGLVLDLAMEQKRNALSAKRGIAKLQAEPSFDINEHDDALSEEVRAYYVHSQMSQSLLNLIPPINSLIGKLSSAKRRGPLR